jgi:hypothetical protein
LGFIEKGVLPQKELKEFVTAFHQNILAFAEYQQTHDQWSLPIAYRWAKGKGDPVWQGRGVSLFFSPGR